MAAVAAAEKVSEEPAPSFWDMVATTEMRLALLAGVGLQVSGGRATVLQLTFALGRCPKGLIEHLPCLGVCEY